MGEDYTVREDPRNSPVVPNGLLQVGDGLLTGEIGPDTSSGREFQ